MYTCYPSPIARNESLQVSRPPSHILAARNTVIALVQNAIIRSFGASYKVELFGSTVYGVDSPSTDLDLVVVVGRLR